VITRWTVDCFKSIGERTSLPLKHLTVFAGSNSSGKSSVLQSILLVAQSLASPRAKTPIVLNGPLVQLGRFKDVAFSGSEKNLITIGFTLDEQALHRQYAIREGGSPSLTSCEFTVGLDGGKIPNPQPVLLESTLRSTDPEEGSVEMDRSTGSFIKLRRKAKGETETVPPRSHLEEIHPGEGTPVTLDNYSIVLDEESRSEIRTGIEGKLIGVDVLHFLPANLRVRLDPGKIFAQYVSYVLCEPQRAAPAPPHVVRGLGYSPLRYVIDHQILDMLLSDLSADQRTALRINDDSAGEPLALTVSDWRRRFRMSSKATSEAVASIRGKRDEVERILLQRYTRDEVEVSRPLPPRLAEATNETRAFADAVAYIGPLREQPRSEHPLAASWTQTTPLDVGLRGEHVAAVLHMYDEHRISYVSSEDFVKGDYSLTAANVHEAVRDWLKYMELALDFKTNDLGRQGYQILLKPNVDAEWRDLTQVGVGVSQLLPIVVASLVAPTNAILILEQPELHLHPRTQALLADFLLSLGVGSQQCIVETHSEHLINRFRLRIAQAPQETLVNALKIYFVEMEGRISTFRQIEINEFGAIPDWPSRFFDQSQLVAQEIILSASQKRRHRS